MYGLAPKLGLCLSIWLAAAPLAAQEALGLSAPPDVADSGLLGFILPRFSLKTGIRVQVDPDGEMALLAAPPGTPVFRDANTVYYLRISDDPRQARFEDWLTSEIGRRTVASFQPEGSAPFSTDLDAAADDEAPVYEGDAALGARVALAACGRCHVVGEANRKKGIGSTPSFPVLKALPDWEDRFRQFYVLNPHQSFTQVAGITQPFDPDRPPHIAPVEISETDLEAIVAYVAVSEAADLGAPLQSQ